MQKQIALDPEFDNTRTLEFVMKTYIERWGKTPEFVVFEEMPGVGPVPTPSMTPPQIPAAALP